MSIQVRANLIDGDLWEIERSEKLWAEYLRLQKEGYTGKRLVHELLTDDWPAPPVRVVLSGFYKGEPVEATIPYD